MFLIIQLYLTCRKDGMQSPTREEMMKSRISNIVADVQENNDAVTDAQKKNDVICECTIPLRMYKRRMMQLQMHKIRMVQVVNIQCTCRCTRREC